MASRIPGPLVAWWIICGMVPVIIRLLSTGILEGGDSVQHYQIARYAWTHPELLLDHWGKPLFTLLASPFAQLGPWGMTLFNACCMVVTAWAADGMLRRSGQVARWVFLPALMLVPVYGQMVLAGMTEVLFGMLAMLVIASLHVHDHRRAMVIASFMPFARPEYLAFVPFAFVWVLAMRQWKALPFVFMGLLVYGLFGWVVLGDALWVLHRDPYLGAADIYGSGPLTHYASQLQYILGSSLMWTTGIALSCGVLLWRWKEQNERDMVQLLLVVALLPALAILAGHSFLWWKGLKGSLGLVRVLATCAPLLVLVAVWPVVRVVRSLLVTGLGLCLSMFLGLGLYFANALSDFSHVQPIPVKAGAEERFLKVLGEELELRRTEGARSLCFDPRLAFYAGLDPFDPNEVILRSDREEWEPAMGLRIGDLLVWDSHFGPNEGGIQLEGLLADSEFELVGYQAPEERMIVLGNRPLEAFLFTRGQRRPGEERRTVLDATADPPTLLPHRFDRDTCAGGVQGWCFKAGEFPLEIGPLPLLRSELIYGEVQVVGQLDLPEGGVDMDLVFVEEGPQGRISYWPFTLQEGMVDITFRVPTRNEAVTNKLYLWNRSQSPFRLQGLRINVRMVYRSAPA